MRGSNAKYSNLQLSVIPPKIGVYGFTLEESESKRTLVRASRVDAAVSFVDLFLGRRRASIVNISDLQLNESIDHLVTRFSKNNITKKTAPSWPPPGYPPVHKVRLINLSASYAWSPKARESQYKIDAQGINTIFTLHNWSWIDADVDINALSFTRDGGDILNAAQIETNIHYKNGFFRSNDFSVQSNEMVVEGGLKGALIKSSAGNKPLVGSRRAGSSDKLKGIRFDIDGNLQGDLGFLGVLIGVDKTYGNVTANAKFSLEQNFSRSPKWNIFADVASQGAVLGGFKLLDSKGIVEVNLEEVRFSDFTVFDQGRRLLYGDGSIQLDGSGPMRFDARSDQFSLADIMNITNARFDAIDFNFAKQELSIDGQVAPFQMDIQTTKGLENLVAPTLGIIGTKKRANPDCDGKVLARINKDELVVAPTRLVCVRPDELLTKTPIQVETKIPFRNAENLKVLLKSNSMQLGLLSSFFAVDASGQGKVDVKIGSAKGGGAKIDVATDLNNASIARLPLGRLAGRLSIVGDKLSTKRIASYTSAQKYLRVENAHMYLGKNVLFDGVVDGKGYSSEDMKDFFDYVFRGKPPVYFGLQKVKGKIDGPFLEPLRWAGDVRLDLRDIEQDGKILLHEIQARLTRDSVGVLNVPSITARYEAKRLNAKGSISNSPGKLSTKRINGLNFPMQIASDTLLALGASPNASISLRGSAAPNGPDFKPFNMLRLLPVGADFAKAFSASADGFGGFELTGSVNNPELTFKGTVSRLQMHGYKQPTTDLMVDMKGSDIVAVFSQPGLLKGSLTNTGDDFSLDLDAKKVNLGWLFPQGVFAGNNRVDSINNLSWNTKGSTLDFWHANGELTLRESTTFFSRDENLFLREKVDLEGLQKSVRLSSPITVGTSQKGWNLLGERAVFKSENIEFFVYTRENNLPSSLGVYVNGGVDLGILPRFNQLVESGKGLAPFDASIRGVLENPIISMKSKNSSPDFGAEFVLRGFYPGFKNLTWDVDFDDGLFNIKKFRAQKGAGSMRVQGGLLMVNDGPRRSPGLKIIGSGMDFRMPAPYLKSVNAKISTDLFLSGTKPPYLVTGTASLDSGSANRDFDLEEEVLKALRAPKYASAKNTQAMFRYRFDMDLSNGFQLRNNNINSVLKGDVAVRGNSIKPILRGRLFMEGGTFTYKREFNITRANIEFLNPEENDPELDISGYSDLPGRRVFLTIQGPLSQANVDMVADPATRDDGTPLTKLDLFILLTTGALPSETEFGGGLGSAAQVELINFFASTVNRPLEKLMEISGQRFIKQPSLEFELSEASGQIIPKLRLPVDVYNALRMNVGINTEGSWEVSTEVPLNRSISLRGSIDGSDNSSNVGAGQSDRDERDAALDMNFRFRFR